MKKENKIQKLKAKAEIFTLCFFALLILLVGCHYEATYVNTCKIISKTETILECENIHTGVRYKCSATETDSIRIGEKLQCKFTNECTESDPYDDHWVGFGEHSFLCFVW